MPFIQALDFCRNLRIMRKFVGNTVLTLSDRVLRTWIEWATSQMQLRLHVI